MQNSKKRLEDLAVSGGSPAFNEKLHVGSPNIGNRTRLIEYIDQILNNRWLTNNGPLVGNLEQKIADYLGVNHCIAICNGTIALEIAIRALGMTGEVIVPSFTFIATAHSLQWQGVTPVFCDIDPLTHNIDPEEIESLITPRTTGIIGVHLWGRPCDIPAIRTIADKHRLKLLFDAAHAFGCSHKGRMIGNFGDAEIFSFHATKFINTFEGGAIVTNNGELAAKIRLMKNFGFAGYDNVIYIGTNGKMTEIAAAMGLTGIEDLQSIIDVNYHNYRQYKGELDGIPGIKLIDYDEMEKCNYQYIVLEIDDTVTGLSRDNLQKILWAENVLARRYFYPGCHNMEPYRSFLSHESLSLEETDGLVQRILCLPTGSSIGKREIAAICGIIRCAVENVYDLKSLPFGPQKGKF